MSDLRSRIESEQEAVEKALDALTQARPLHGLSTLELAGVGALLHNFYNGLENILKQILLAKGLGMPEGPAWHRDQLTAVQRHQILTEATTESLKPFLAFRHFFSHAYALDLDPQRMEPLVASAHDVCQAVMQEIGGSL